MDLNSLVFRRALAATIPGIPHRHFVIEKVVDTASSSLSLSSVSAFLSSFQVLRGRRSLTNSANSTISSAKPVIKITFQVAANVEAFGYTNAGKAYDFVCGKILDSVNGVGGSTSVLTTNLNKEAVWNRAPSLTNVSTASGLASCSLYTVTIEHIPIPKASTQLSVRAIFGIVVGSIASFLCCSYVGYRRWRQQREIREMKKRNRRKVYIGEDEKDGEEYDDDDDDAPKSKVPAPSSSSVATLLDYDM